MLLARDEIDVNQATADDDEIPLYVACWNGHTEIVAMLLARDEIEVNQATTDHGATPLSIACDNGHTEIVAMLLAFDGIDVNQARADDGITPLHGAAINGDLVSAQLLVVCGARLTATGSRGWGSSETPAQVATRDHPVLAEWLNAVVGWSPLRVAAGCRLHKEVAVLLRQGRLDPDDLATTSIKGIMQVVATATTTPAALLWQNAPPICNATVKLVTGAFSGLHCTTYWLHHAGVRKAVFATLVVAKHLDEEDSLRWAEEAEEEAEPPVIASDGNYVTTPTDDALPILAPEIWLHALSFVKRSWWNPCLRRGHR